MATKNIKDCTIINISLSDGKPLYYILKDKNGDIIKPSDFPKELNGKSFQLMKRQVENEKAR